MDNEKFGKFIQKLRKENNLTQKQLGEKLNIENILIAHNQDDLIETYLMQKERKSLLQKL